MDSNGNKNLWVRCTFISCLLGVITILLIDPCICIYIDGLSIRDVSPSDFLLYNVKVVLSLADKNSVYRMYVLCSFILLMLLGRIIGIVLAKRYNCNVGKYIIGDILTTLPGALFIIFMPRIIGWLSLLFFGEYPDHDAWDDFYDMAYDIVNNMTMVLPRFLSVIKSIAP